MKVFQIIRKISEVVGIYMSKIDRRQSINLRSFACLSSKVIYFSTSAAYLGFRANSPPEYGSDFEVLIKKRYNLFFKCLTSTGDTFYICATEMTIGIAFISMVFNITNVSKLTEKLEIFIQTSKL